MLFYPTALCPTKVWGDKSLQTHRAVRYTAKGEKGAAAFLSLSLLEILLYLWQLTSLLFLLLLLWLGSAAPYRPLRPKHYWSAGNSGPAESLSGYGAFLPNLRFWNTLPCFFQIPTICSPLKRQVYHHLKKGYFPPKGSMLKWTGVPEIGATKKSFRNLV